MIIYKCRFTGDEMLSDAFKPTSVKDEAGNEVEGLLQIQSQKVNKVRVPVLLLSVVVATSRPPFRHCTCCCVLRVCVLVCRCGCDV
jgi:hypothetical protein